MKLKKGSFRMLHRQWWRACRANKIQREALLVLLALEAGPWGAGQYTGLYHISPSDISNYTGLTDKEVAHALNTLERRNAIAYDRAMRVVFVKGMLARQSPNFASTEKNLLGVSNHVERMPEDSPAVREFVTAQRNVPELFELLEAYFDVGFEQTLDLRPEDPDTRNHETIISLRSDEMTPSVSPSSTSRTKGNGKGHPASKGGHLPDGVTEMLHALTDGQRVAVENRWKEIQAGKITRPQARDEIRKAGWLDDRQIQQVIPERGGPTDWLTGWTP